MAECLRVILEVFVKILLNLILFPLIPPNFGEWKFEILREKRKMSVLSYLFYSPT